jgi:hypothetical protein
MSTKILPEGKERRPALRLAKSLPSVSRILEDAAKYVFVFVEFKLLKIYIHNMKYCKVLIYINVVQMKPVRGRT